MDVDGLCLTRLDDYRHIQDHNLSSDLWSRNRGLIVIGASRPVAASIVISVEVFFESDQMMMRRVQDCDRLEGQQIPSWPRGCGSETIVLLMLCVRGGSYHRYVPALIVEALVEGIPSDTSDV